MSDDASFAHFADGLVEDLTTRLQAEGLKVASRQSAFAYRDRAADARTIARELDCTHVLEGSVRKIGDRVRLTAQLIDARNDEHLWAERFDRRNEDAFELQDEVCEPIVAAVVTRLGGGALASPAATVGAHDFAASRNSGLAVAGHDAGLPPLDPPGESTARSWHAGGGCAPRWLHSPRG